MRKYLQNHFFLSEEGAKNMEKGILYSALLNISFMLPMGLLFIFIHETLEIYVDHVKNGYDILKYPILAIFILAVIYWANTRQYDNVYTNTYTETAKKRVELSNRLRKLPLSFFAHRDLSDLTTTILSDMEAMEHAYSHAVPSFYGTILSVLFIALSISLMSPWMALALLWPFPIAIGFLFLMRKKKYEKDKAHADEKLIVSEKIQEMIENILPIKAFGRKEKSMNELKEILEREEKQHLKSEFLNPLLLGPVSSLLRLGVISAILTGMGQYAAGNLSLSRLILLIIACATIYLPMDGALSFIIEFIYVQVPARRMHTIMNMPVMTGEDLSVDNFDLELSHVDFGYEDREVLHDISFIAKQGETTALVGPSGSGKSTLARLMLRFWDVDGGKITLGGKDLRDFDPESLLKNYSVVFQEVLLFNNTVMENIRIGKRGATDEEVFRAAKIACVDDFVQRFPEGYQTKIGENGILLSGGERQRISIARAVLKDAPIIFLDESTSSVDAQSETKLQKALSQLIQNKTVVVIAHRLRTVEEADKIIVLKEGRLVETGNAKELIAKEGEFYRLWKTQKE